VRAVRDLLDHPKISPLLEDLVGDPGLAKDGLPSFRIDHICADVLQCRQAQPVLTGSRPVSASQILSAAQWGSQARVCTAEEQHTGLSSLTFTTVASTMVCWS
jgi:hypothetical protein